MRQAQVGLFTLGVVLFLSAAFFIEQQMGDTLWRAGVAVTMIDLVSMRLWPPPKV